MAKKIPKAERSDLIAGWNFNYKFMENITAECREKDNGDVYQEMVDSVLNALHLGGYIDIES